METKFINRYCLTVKDHLVILAALVLIFSILFISCKKSDEEDNTPQNINPTNIEGSENLGSGYDVFDNYAEVLKVKAAILDVDALDAAGLIEIKTVEESIFSTKSGTSIDEYSNSLSLSAGLSGGFKYFSGAIESNFHYSRYSYESYSFSTVKSMIQKTQLRIPIDVEVSALKPYLTVTARSKLNDPEVQPYSIFEIYGTHCLTGVILGGRLDYSVSAKTTDINQSIGIGLYAERSFSAGGVSASSNQSIITEQEYNKYLSSQQKIVKTYGGQSEFGQDIINEDDYDNWIASIDGRTVFCNFTEHGLVPVWEFCDEQSRKDELMSAFESWATDREIVVYPAPQFCILDIKVMFGSSVPDPLLIEGREYHRLHADLNASVGGQLIWIYYLLGYENDETFEPIAEICTIDETDGETLGALPGEGWVKLPEDLNKGAGGDLIYLAYRRINESSENILTGVRVEHDAKNDNYYSLYTNGSNNWYAVQAAYNSGYKQDLNEGSGGWYIWLHYTYDNIIEE
ncbi:MAG: MAC/perforin domain-containing protein [Bacteroidota bacterium]